MKNFGQIITPMITPFDEQLQLDLAKTTHLLQHLIDQGVNSVIVGGVTGESETLTRDEKLLLFKHVKQTSQKKLNTIASVNMNTPDETMKFIEQIDELGFADGFFVSIPYYVGLNQEGIYRYIERITKLTDLPILLYNGPIKAGVYIEPQTVIRLSRIANVIGIQEASEDLPSITKIISGASDTFSVYSGDDRFALPILAIGGKGVVSVASHVWGRKISDMIYNYKRGQTKRASECHQDLSMYFEDFHERNPTFMKHVLKARGMDMGDARNLYLDLMEDDAMFARLIFGNAE